jgi:predicted DNA-binding protein with PD1-like motif
MRTKLLHQVDGKRTFAVVMKSGDEAMACLQEFAISQAISGAQVTAIGAFSAAELAFFDWNTKAYHPIAVDEQVEVASLIGDIAQGPDGKPSIHLHAVLGRQDGSTRAGHLNRGDVRPTLEVIVTEMPTHLCKKKDPESGLALIDLKATA